MLRICCPRNQTTERRQRVVGHRQTHPAAGCRKAKIAFTQRVNRLRSTCCFHGHYHQHVPPFASSSTAVSRLKAPVQAMQLPSISKGDRLNQEVNVLPHNPGALRCLFQKALLYPSVLLDKKPSSGPILVEIDGLWGFAFLLVLASHTNLWHLGGAGANGVWLFFVLSAFLLTKIMLAKMPASISWREIAKYVIRRIARIIPAYWLCLSIIALLDARPRKWLFRHLFFMQADGHFWSIPHEELFYLVLPVLVASVYVLKRWMRIPAPITAGALMVGVVAGIIPVHFVTLNGNGLHIPFFLEIFMFGFFLAHFWDIKWVRRLRTSKWFVPIANVIGLACLLALLVGGSKEYLEYCNRWIRVPGVYLGWEHPTVFAAISAILIFVTLTPGSYAQRVFSWKGMRLVGVLSFSLYLVHVRVLALLEDKAGFKFGFILFICAFLLSLFVSIIFERLVERPCMQYGRRINARL